MKKEIKILLFIIITTMPLFAQQDHIAKFLKCGLPKLEDYKCFDYSTIEATNPIEWELSDDYNKKQIPKRFLAQMAFMRTASFMVIKDGKILHEEYWLNYTENSKMNSFSVAKSIVALLVGIAIKDGKIQSINQKVKDFIPYYSDGLDSNLTIIDLLSMSSGTNWTEEFANPMSDIAIAYYGSSLDSLMIKTHLEESPGNKWHYQCGNTVILAMILEKATGQKIYEYAQEKLWTPLGTTNDAYWGKDNPDGMTKAFCCFYATPRDFAKLGLLVLNNGKFNGQQIVPAEFIEAATQPANWLTYKGKPVDFYGLHFWLVNFHKKKIPYMSGVFGQYIFIFPKQNAVVIRFGEMLNELKIQPIHPDVPLYLKVADKFI
ncbi:MAG: serine hydrolase [Bacteroidales bacterium]|nr:serine hydrolase [Bacteroidales bacterium]